MNWDWKVFLADDGGGRTYLQWMFDAWGWTLAVAGASWVVAMVVGGLIGTLRTLPNSPWPLCAGLRRPGAAALDLCYVAAGFCDGFFETGLSPWDIAAGSLLITEAGGLIGNFTGEADFLYQREVVAGNPKIYGQLVPLLAPFTRVIKDEAEPAAASTAPAPAALSPEAALAATVAAPAEPARKAVRVRKAAEPKADDAPF